MARRNSHDGSVLRRLSGSFEDLRQKVMDPLGSGSSHNPRTTKWAGRKPTPRRQHEDESDSDSDDESSFGNPNWEEDRQLSKEETMYWEEMAKEIENLDI